MLSAASRKLTAGLNANGGASAKFRCLRNRWMQPKKNAV
nr:MAG TPA: hypothetical protein [Caudoviricetes sp.]